MKYIVYLFYIIAKYEYWSFHIFDNIGFTGGNDKKMRSERILNNATNRYTQMAYKGGELAYFSCILMFLYKLGYKQVELLFSNVVTLGVAFALFSIPLEYFLLYKDDRLKKYSAEFAQFSSKQKFKYGTVALVLFLLPIVTLIIEFVCF